MQKLHTFLLYLSSTTVATKAHQPTAVTSNQSGPPSNYAVVQKPTTKRLPHLTVNSGDKYALSTNVSNQLGPSSDYAAVQKSTTKKVPHLTVNSGDKYALSTHDSLKRVKQQQPATEHTQVSTLSTTQIYNVLMYCVTHTYSSSTVYTTIPGYKFFIL